MIKGLISLFTSGAVFHPMVLLGIIGGLYSITHLAGNDIREILTDGRLYLAAAVLSLIYSFGFKRIYQEGGRGVDFGATFLSAIAGIVRFILAYVLSMSFVLMLSF